MTSSYTTNYYDLIELPRDASSQQIWDKIAHERQKAHNQLHAQDRQVQDRARERIRMLDETIRVLLNPAERSRFDRWLEDQISSMADQSADFRNRAWEQIHIDRQEREILDAAAEAKSIVRKAHSAQAFEDAVSVFQEVRRATEEAEANLQRWEERTPYASRAVEEARTAQEHVWSIIGPSIEKEIDRLFRMGRHDKAEQILIAIGQEKSVPLKRGEVERLIRIGHHDRAVQFGIRDQRLEEKVIKLRDRQKIWFQVLMATPGALGMLCVILGPVHSYLDIGRVQSFIMFLGALYLAVGTGIASRGIGAMGMCLRNGRTGYILAVMVGVFWSIAWPLLALFGDHAESTQAMLGGLVILFAPAAALSYWLLDEDVFLWVDVVLCIIAAGMARIAADD